MALQQVFDKLKIEGELVPFCTLRDQLRTKLTVYKKKNGVYRYGTVNMTGTPVENTVTLLIAGSRLEDGKVFLPSTQADLVDVLDFLENTPEEGDKIGGDLVQVASEKLKAAYVGDAAWQLQAYASMGLKLTFTDPSGAQIAHTPDYKTGLRSLREKGLKIAREYHSDGNDEPPAAECTAELPLDTDEGCHTGAYIVEKIFTPVDHHDTKKIKKELGLSHRLTKFIGKSMHRGDPVKPAKYLAIFYSNMKVHLPKLTEDQALRLLCTRKGQIEKSQGLLLTKVDQTIKKDDEDDA